MTELEYILTDEDYKTFDEICKELNIEKTDINLECPKDIISLIYKCTNDPRYIAIAKIAVSEFYYEIKEINVNNLLLKGSYVKNLEVEEYYDDFKEVGFNKSKIEFIKLIKINEELDKQKLLDAINDRKFLTIPKEKYKECFDLLNPILSQVYPEKYDLQINYNNINILIKFDEILITNSKNEKKIINDLYVVLQFNVYSKTITNFQGFRSVFSVEDAQKGYAHSHLPGIYDNLFLPKTFCTGSTDLTVLLNDLKVEFDPIKFELLLYQIGDFIKWESLEGTPYIKISDSSIRNNQYCILNTQNLQTITTYDFENLLKNISEDGTIVPDVDFGISEFGEIQVVIKNKEKLSKLISKYTPRKGIMVDNKVVRYVNPNEEIVSSKIEDLLLSTSFYSDVERAKFKNFRLNPINYEIKIQSKNFEGEEEFYTDPELFEQFCYYITTNIEEEIRREIFSEEKSSSLSKSRYPNENLVPLF